MSLHIYFDGVDTLPNMRIEHDVVKLFTKIAITGCAYDKAVIKNIELGEYKDGLFFIDRFNSLVRIDCLSMCFHEVWPMEKLM